MLPEGERTIKFLRIGEFLYILLIILAYYLLFVSRTGEAYTVWQVLHPAFIPTLFAATLLMLSILMTSEKTKYKLLFIVIHSVLIHSFFSVVFPVGDLSGQQIVLGRTRVIYDNAILHGWPPWPVETIQSRVYEWLRGVNFQAALSVAFARMLSIDVLWIHLFLVPVLWGAFTPIAVYLATYTLTKNEKVSVLASLLISAFPYATYFGAISVPNSLGFIFFFFAVYFMLKNLDSDDSKNKVLMLAFSFISFLSHYLTGIISLSLLLLTIAFKSYKNEKEASSTTSKFSLMISFIISASLLPLSLIYLRFFRPITQTAFTLDKFFELPFEEIVGLFFLGGLYGFDLKTILLNVIGPVLAFLYMTYLLFKLKRNSKIESQIHVLFLFTVFLMIFVDYRILKLFMSGLPFNEERLWVFRDFALVPFVALAIYGVSSYLNTFLRARSPSTLSWASLRALSKGNVTRILSLLFILNVLIPLVLSGWITLSLSAAYPKVAPLQTTWYELEAVKYIEANTKEKYVVIGDMWTIYAGEVIVGINNPRAYYFLEQDIIGYDLFVNMKREPSPQWMLQAMNYTNTNVAYFIVTEPRLGTEEFNNVVSLALESSQFTVNVFGAGKLYVFGYKKG